MPDIPFLAQLAENNQALFIIVVLGIVVWALMRISTRLSDSNSKSNERIQTLNGRLIDLTDEIIRLKTDLSLLTEKVESVTKALKAEREAHQKTMSERDGWHTQYLDTKLELDNCNGSNSE